MLGGSVTQICGGGGGGGGGGGAHQCLAAIV